MGKRLLEWRVIVVNATGADGYENYHKHYDNITTNNTTFYSNITQTCY